MSFILKLWRGFRCAMDINHRLKKKWWPEETAGMSMEAAKILYHSDIRDVKISYLECLDCHCKMAPFEAGLRGWKEIA